MIVTRCIGGRLEMPLQRAGHDTSSFLIRLVLDPGK